MWHKDSSARPSTIMTIEEAEKMHPEVIVLRSLCFARRPDQLEPHRRLFPDGKPNILIKIEHGAVDGVDCPACDPSTATCRLLKSCLTGDGGGEMQTAALNHQNA